MCMKETFSRAKHGLIRPRPPISEKNKLSTLGPQQT